jgi:hypothetical protein
MQRTRANHYINCKFLMGSRRGHTLADCFTINAARLHTHNAVMSVKKQHSNVGNSTGKHACDAAPCVLSRLVTELFTASAHGRALSTRSRGGVSRPAFGASQHT